MDSVFARVFMQRSINANKNAAASAKRDAKRNISKPGLRITKTPIKPINKAKTLGFVRLSLSRITARIEAIAGFKNAIAVASTSGLYFIAESQAVTAKRPMVDLSMCNFMRFVLKS